jgi:hypothetical protein
MHLDERYLDLDVLFFCEMDAKGTKNKKINNTVDTPRPCAESMQFLLLLSAHLVHDIFVRHSGAELNVLGVAAASFMCGERDADSILQVDKEPSPRIYRRGTIPPSARRWNSARGSSSFSIGRRRLRPPNDANARRHRRRREHLGRAPDTQLLVSSAVLAWRHCRSPPPPRPRTPLVPQTLRASASRTSSWTRNCQGVHACALSPLLRPGAVCIAH